MRKLVLGLLILFLCSNLSAGSKDINLFDVYTKPNGDTRYIVVLKDNSIHWFSPRQGWTKSSSKGLPDQDIKLISSYTRGKDTRYVTVLSDNSIYWFSPKQGWKKSSAKGLPGGYDIKSIKGYSKRNGDTRYAAVLSDNSIYWFSPRQGWTKSSSKGLP